MSTTANQLGRIQELIEKLVTRLHDSERKQEALQAEVDQLRGDLAAFSQKPLKNVEEIHDKIDSYLKDIDICLEKLNGQSKTDTK